MKCSLYMLWLKRTRHFVKMNFTANKVGKMDHSYYLCSWLKHFVRNQQYTYLGFMVNQIDSIHLIPDAEKNGSKADFVQSL